MKELISQVRGGAKNGRRRAIARLISRIENDDQAAREAIMILYADTGRAHIIGITGPPGSGKSTLVNEIAKDLRQRELSVGIVAVDPSSPFTGGALLGDRVRMRDLSGDEGIFIRSMASRGSLGGLARTTSNVVKVLDAAGYEVVLIETVGAGQTEVDIASAAHTTLVLEAPGMGDEIQTIKAGILEIADLLVVNKADRPGSDNAVKALKMMLHMGAANVRMRHHSQMLTVSLPAPVENGGKTDENWEIPVLKTVATTGEGVATVVDTLLAHKGFLIRSDEWGVRELARSRRELTQLLQARFMARLTTLVPEFEREAMIAEVAARKTDPYTAVARLFAHIQA